MIFFAQHFAVIWNLISHCRCESNWKLSQWLVFGLPMCMRNSLHCRSAVCETLCSDWRQNFELHIRIEVEFIQVTGFELSWVRKDSVSTSWSSFSIVCRIRYSWLVVSKSVAVLVIRVPLDTHRNAFVNNFRCRSLCGLSYCMSYTSKRATPRIE